MDRYGPVQGNRNVLPLVEDVAGRLDDQLTQMLVRPDHIRPEAFEIRGKRTLLGIAGVPVLVPAAEVIPDFGCRESLAGFLRDV